MRWSPKALQSPIISMRTCSGAVSRLSVRAPISFEYSAAPPEDHPWLARAASAHLANMLKRTWLQAR